MVCPYSISCPIRLQVWCCIFVRPCEHTSSVTCQARMIVCQDVIFSPKRYSSEPMLFHLISVMISSPAFRLSSAHDHGRHSGDSMRISSTTARLHSWLQPWCQVKHDQCPVCRSGGKLWSSPTHGSVNGSSPAVWLDLHRVRATSAQRRSSLGPVRARRLLTQAYDDDLQFFVPHLLKCGYFAGRRLARDRPPARSVNLVRRAHRPWRICLKVRAPDRTEMWLALRAF